MHQSFGGLLGLAGMGTWLARWRGLVAVLALFISFGALNVFGVPPLTPYDERAHLGYSLSLAQGQLPTIESKLPTAVFGRARGVRAHVWVANHPPLFYGLAAPFTQRGLSVAGLPGAVTYGRWVSLVLAAIGLVFVHACARLLSNGDARFALFATLVAASFPSLVQISSLVHNDGLAFLVAAAGLHSAMVLVMKGYTPRRVAAVAIWSSLAMLTRFTSVAVVGAMGLIACCGLLLTSGEPLRRRLLRSVTTGTLMVASVCITSGWFYLRNLRLYGDITGGAVLFEKFGRSPRGSAFKHAMNVDNWTEIYRDLWTRFGGGVRIPGFISDVAWLLLFTACIGLSFRAYNVIRQRPLPTWFTLRTVCAVGLAAAVFASLAAMFAFYSRGGKLHARYLLPVLWVVAMAMAWGLSAFGTRMVRLTTVFLGMLNLLVFTAALGAFAQEDGGDPVELVRVLEQRGMTNAAWVVGLVLLTVALSTHVILEEYAKASTPTPAKPSARINPAEAPTRLAESPA